MWCAKWSVPLRIRGVERVSIKLVRDLMHIGVTTCQADTSLLEGVRRLIRDELESLIVLDPNGHAVGMFSRREAVAAYGRAGVDVADLKKLTVADTMRPDIPQVPPDIPVTAAAQMMLDQDLREIYLMHHGGGISWPAAALRYQDVLRHIAADSEADLADLGARATRRSPIEMFKERYSKDS
jgi:CBS domain-containing protein